MRNAFFDEPLCPIAQRTERDAKGRLMGFANAATSRRRTVPREEGQDRSRLAGLVTIIEMIGCGIVEIHGPLHEPQTEVTGIEIEIFQRVASDRRHMMDA